MEAFHCEPTAENLIACFVGNPMKANKLAVFVVRLSMDAIRVSSVALPFTLTANT